MFGSYDETILSNQVILSGLKKVVPGHSLRFVHAGVPKAVLYESSHLGSIQIEKRIAHRFTAQLRLLQNCTRVIDCDVLLILPFGLIDLVQAWVYKHVFGKKIIYVPQNSLYDLFVYASGKNKNNSVREWMLFHLERTLWKIPDLMVFNSDIEAQVHKKLLELPDLKTAVIPLGADDKIFTPAKINAKRKQIEVLFYGEYNLAQGAEFIVSAAGLLKHIHSIHFSMIGEGRTKATVETLAKKKNLKNVTFLTWQNPESLLAHIRNADIVLGMFSDTSVSRRVVPNKVFQGLACRKAVVTARSPASESFLRHKLNVFFVPMQNAHSLANAINILAKDNGLRNSIAEHGYEMFTKQFTPVAISETLLNSIKELI